MNNLTITLADGTELKDIKVNGTAYISTTKFNTSILTDRNLKKISITSIREKNKENNDTEEEIKTTFRYNLKCTRVWEVGDEIWFNLVEKTADQLFKEKVQAQIDYIAMMTDVEV